jgi:hypothetical protein
MYCTKEQSPHARERGPKRDARDFALSRGTYSAQWSILNQVQGMKNFTGSLL